MLLAGYRGLRKDGRCDVSGKLQPCKGRVPALVCVPPNILFRYRCNEQSLGVATHKRSCINALIR